MYKNDQQPNRQMLAARRRLAARFFSRNDVTNGKKRGLTDFPVMPAAVEKEFS